MFATIPVCPIDYVETRYVNDRVLRKRSGRKQQSFCRAFGCAGLKQVFPHLPSDVAEGHKYCVSRRFLVHVMPVDTFTQG